MIGFRGWDAAALWEDLKFDVKHFADIERLAMVGNNPWQQHLAKSCRLFTKAKVRYFDHTSSAHARKWLDEAAVRALL